MLDCEIATRFFDMCDMTPSCSLCDVAAVFVYVCVCVCVCACVRVCMSPQGVWCLDIHYAASLNIAFIQIRSALRMSFFTTNY